MRRLLISLLTLPLGLAFAGERELASDGDAVGLSIDENYQCSNPAKVTINTGTADYFDQGAPTIQRLSDTARAILGLECPKVSKIEFIGVTGSVPIFRADAQRDHKWRLESYPAPLEGVALLFRTREPSFFDLGTIAIQFEPFKKVPGILEAFQYKAYEEQLRRHVGVADGNIEAFKTYLREPDRPLGSFENALEHFRSILRSIEVYSPAQYPAYKQAFEEVSTSLKDDYWAAQIATLFDDDDFIVTSVVQKARAMASASSSRDFVEYVDGAVASWIQEEADYIRGEFGKSPLYEVGLASDFLAGMPNPSAANSLPKTRTLLQTLPAELAPIVARRASELQALATGTIQDAGGTYADVSDIMETGFALAEEFEDAGYPAEGEALLRSTFAHIAHVLSSDLTNYKAELASTEFNASNATALQEQATVFDELSAEFEGFNAYREATEEALSANKLSICKSILRDAGASERDAKRRIAIGSDATSLEQFSCDMFANGHVVTALGKPNGGNRYLLSIQETSGQSRSFVLSDQGSTLKVVTGDDGSPVSTNEWGSYASTLVRPPANGKPDAKGVRDCDRLAADPNDPKKLARGVDFEKSNVDPDAFERAVDACIAAVEHAPDDPRQQFQLGRLLWYAGDQDTAREYFDVSSKSGYPAAMFHKAELLLATSNDQNAFVDALELYEAAGKAGYARGAAMVKELNPEGIAFFREIPAPSGADILASLPKKKMDVSLFGMTSFAEIIDIKVKDCFQINASDFSCEYRKIVKCGMSSARPDPVVGFMSKLMQMDCAGTQYTFGSFRKQSDSKWKILPDQP